MGFIAIASFVLAVQTQPKGTPAQKTAKPALTKVSSEGFSNTRLSEIWDHIDNRVLMQTDIWYELGEFPSCVSLLRIQAAYTPDNYDVCTNLGWMLENIDRNDDALAAYLDFGNRHPNVGDAIFALGNAYFNMKDYKNSIKYLEPSLDKHPNENSYRILAKAYERDGRPKEAIRIWELELTRFPNEQTPIANIKRVKAKMAAGGK